MEGLLSFLKLCEAMIWYSVVIPTMQSTIVPETLMLTTNRLMNETLTMDKENVFAEPAQWKGIQLASSFYKLLELL
jgi:hypothetical protein